MKTYVSAKLHGIRVTDKSVAYVGSVSISRTLMAAAGIAPYEQVHVVDLRNGNRWITYALPLEEEGAFTLNGGGALLGEVGDACVIMTYATTDSYEPAQVIFCDAENVIREHLTYD